MEEGYKLLDTFHHPKYNIETYVLKRNKDMGFHQLVDKDGDVIETKTFHDLFSMNWNFSNALDYFPIHDIRKWFAKNMNKYSRCAGVIDGMRYSLPNLFQHHGY